VIHAHGHGAIRAGQDSRATAVSSLAPVLAWAAFSHELARWLAVHSVAAADQLLATRANSQAAIHGSISIAFLVADRDACGARAAPAAGFAHLKVVAKVIFEVIVVVSAGATSNYSADEYNQCKEESGLHVLL